jgi:hypothetical protein
LCTKITNARIMKFPIKIRFKQCWSGVHIFVNHIKLSGVSSPVNTNIALHIYFYI